MNNNPQYNRVIFESIFALVFAFISGAAFAFDAHIAMVSSGALGILAIYCSHQR